eukprot:NODE_529_length_6421_cov_0.324739.p3 type:complete len:123 gc:universal NODE_529_length_6421_cov_0.324739:2008-1640(-)
MGLQLDINEFIKKCYICQTAANCTKSQLIWTSIHSKVIAIDVVGPLCRVSEDDGIEFTHILKIAYIKTRFIEFVALTNTTGQNIATTVDIDNGNLKTIMKELISSIKLMDIHTISKDRQAEI